MRQVLGDAVRRRSFEEAPDEFVGVEFRGITRKEMGMDSAMAAQQGLDDFRPVRATPVPQQDDRTPDVPQEVTDKPGDLLCPNVSARMKTEVQRPPFSPGRDAEGRNGRDLRPVSGHHQHRRAPAGRPSSLDARNQKEAGFIQKDQMRPKSLGFFLYRAKDNASNEQWRLRSSLSPACPASGNSIGRPPSASRHWRWNNGLRYAS